MSRIQVGDTVAFRREVVSKCSSEGIAAFRGTVTGIAGEWLFMKEKCGGRLKVMQAASMCKVASSGAVLQLV